ncbi:hypothetical protein BR93DRAFT_931849 [Coniochaeta sp. PMI_546]|nr:hypothetical protein BR93DRAFT_931849 [Coniochaeta sp. PMI_546]
MDTIDESLSRHHCPAEKTLPEWIQSIYDEFSLAENERKQNARRAYREILGEPRNSTSFLKAPLRKPRPVCLSC